MRKCFREKKKIRPDKSAVDSQRETQAAGRRFSIPALKPKAEPSKLLDHEMKIT